MSSPLSSKKDGYILVIDQSTTSSTALIFEFPGWNITSQVSIPFKQHYPQPSWVEHDLEEVWNSVKQACSQACQRASQTDISFSKERILCIGITNQRETFCLTDHAGLPQAPAITWQCKRSTDICHELRAQGLEEDVKKRTGLPLDPYFSATKFLWWLRNTSKVKELRSNALRVGTIDSYLTMRLTAGSAHVTEPSNASRTMLFNLEHKDWDKKLLQIFEVPSVDILPHILDSHAYFGSTHDLEFLPNDIPITGILGDQQAALLGQQCLQPLQGKCTYGTGAFLLVNVGEDKVDSQHGLLSTIGWQINGKCTYLLEGSSFIAGAGIDYLKEAWGFFEDYSQLSTIMSQHSASPHVMFVPGFAGLGAPYWDPHVKATLLGLSRDTPREVIIRAMIEGVMFSVYDLAYACEQDTKQKLSVLQVDGGMSQNDMAMQFQADVLNVHVTRPYNIEATAFGAAIMAAYGAGLIDSYDIHTESVFLDFHTFQPKMDVQQRDIHLRGWKSAISAAQIFASTKTS